MVEPTGEARCFTAARLLTGQLGEAVDDAAIVVQGRTITAVGRRDEVVGATDVASGAITDLGNATLMPGLIDCHVHLGFDGGPAPVARMMRETDAEQLVLMLRSARELLSVGVTTARDLGARSFLDVVVRDAIAAGTARGPRMLVAGPPLTPTGGHCWFMGGECDTADEVRHRVRLHHRHRTDVVKVMATGGFMTYGSTPWTVQFTEDQLVAAVDEARRLDKPVAAHAHGIVGIERAVAAGVDTIEHCSFATPDNRRAVDRALAERIAGSHAFVCATTNARIMDTIAVATEPLPLAVGPLHDAGVRFIAGTDAGIDLVPHAAYVGGLEALAALGLPVEEVLFAATGLAADALGVAGVTGRLRVGLEADVLAVDGDPRAELGALRRLRLVLARGEAFTPDPIAPRDPAPVPQMLTPPGTPVDLAAIRSR